MLIWEWIVKKQRLFEMHVSRKSLYSKNPWGPGKRLDSLQKGDDLRNRSFAQLVISSTSLSIDGMQYCVFPINLWLESQVHTWTSNHHQHRTKKLSSQKQASSQVLSYCSLHHIAFYQTHNYPSKHISTSRNNALHIVNVY